MSDGIKPTRIEREGYALPDEVSIDGAYTGDDVDWDSSPGMLGFDQWKQPVRAATTAAITIATALNNGDTLDGVTLATGDRVLVKDQGASAEQNGIYIVGATPVRSDDLDEDAEVLGAVVYVIAGTANTGTAWKVTNTAATVVGTDAITWAAFGGSGGVTWGTPAIVLGTAAAAGSVDEAIRRDATIVAFDGTNPTTQALGDSAATGSAAIAARRDHKHAMPAAAVGSSGLTMSTARLLGRTTASTGAIEEITVGTGLSLSAGSLTATGGGGGTFAGARVYNSSNIALTATTETKLTFNSERYDTDAFHDTGSNTGRLTIPTGKGGYYHIGANVSITAASGEPTYVRIRLNNTTTIAIQTVFNNGTFEAANLSCDYALADGDYVEVDVYVQNGSKNAIAAGNYSPEFWLHKIG